MASVVFCAVYIEIEDLLHQFNDPNVVDIKMGTRLVTGKKCFILVRLTLLPAPPQLLGCLYLETQACSSFPLSCLIHSLNETGSDGSGGVGGSVQM